MQVAIDVRPCDGLPRSPPLLDHDFVASLYDKLKKWLRSHSVLSSILLPYVRPEPN